MEVSGGIGSVDKLVPYVSKCGEVGDDLNPGGGRETRMEKGKGYKDVHS